MTLQLAERLSPRWRGAVSGRQPAVRYWSPLFDEVTRHYIRYGA